MNILIVTLLQAKIYTAERVDSPHGLHAIKSLLNSFFTIVNKILVNRVLVIKYYPVACST